VSISNHHSVSLLNTTSTMFSYFFWCQLLQELFYLGVDCVLFIIMFICFCSCIYGWYAPRTPFDHIWAMVWSGARGNIAI